MLANLFATLAADHARSGHPLLAFSAKVCPLTGPSPAVWLHLSTITGRLTLRIVAGVALGVLVNGGSAGALHPRRGRGWRCSRCSASSPGCRACGLPLTEWMIWPQALTYGVPTLALCWQGCCELLIVNEGAKLPGVVIPGVPHEHLADPAFACRADLHWLRVMDVRAMTKHRDSGVPVVFPGDCSDCE
jgi:hypothetical protein